MNPFLQHFVKGKTHFRFWCSTQELYLSKPAIEIRVQLKKRFQQVFPCLEESEDSSEKKQSSPLSK